MTTGVKGLGLENMVIADTGKDKEPKVITTCSDCHYNVYRMLGEEAQKLKEPDERGEHYYPFSQNGKIVQVVTYIQSAYRDGYKHGHKDGYKNGFDDGWVTGRDGITEEQAIAFLQQSGWLKDYEDAVVRKANLCCRANSNFESEHMSAVLKDLYDSLESEDAEMDEIDFIQPKKTVGKLISVGVLDKIRAEIEASKWTDKDIRIERNALASGLDKALEIIDKYKAESEEQG